MTTDQTLTAAERTMLAYALDQAQEKIWSEGGFTDEDQAAVTSLRRLTAVSSVGQAPATSQTAAVLSETEREVLLHALELAEEETLSLGDENAEEKVAAMDSLRRMADEAAAGRVADDTQAEAKPGCAHCGGPHAWDDCEAYTALVQQDGEGDEDEALRAKVDEATATLRRIRALTKDWDSRVLPRSQAHRLLIEVCDALAGPRPDRDRSAVGGAQQQEDDRG